MAVLLHKSVDFELMVMTLLEGANHPIATTRTNKTTETQLNKDDKDDKILFNDSVAGDKIIMPLATSVGFMVAYFLYPSFTSKSQRQQ